MSSNSESDVSEDQEIAPQDVVKGQIRNHLHRIHSAGSFATSGIEESFALPGLTVEGLGEVQVPLSQAGYDGLIGISRKAPFGLDGQTLVDENVRSTWEIDASNIGFGNDQWTSWLDELTRKAAEGLGVADLGNVSAKLHKMLLYNENAKFEPHKDTEKTPGMFATLVVCLPSCHTGGLLRLQFHDEEKEFDSSTQSAFSVRWAAWYADVEHQVLPVQSGCRWALAYNMVRTYDEMDVQSASQQEARVQDLCHSLSTWNSSPAPAHCLCYALSHQYSHKSLSLKNLKGDDFYRAKHTVEACSRGNNFLVMFASIERILEFSNGEDDDGEPLSESLELVRMVDLYGNSLGGPMTIPIKWIVQDGLYSKREVDERRGGHYMGNQHAEMNEIYKDTAMLLVRRNTCCELLLGGNNSVKDFEELVLRLTSIGRVQNSLPDTRELIVEACEDHFVRRYSDDKEKDSFMGAVATAAFQICDQQLFQRALGLTKDGFDEHSCMVLGRLLSFEKPAVPMADFVSALSGGPSFHGTWKRLRGLEKGYRSRSLIYDKDERYNAVVSWTEERSSESLASVTTACADDSCPLLEATAKYSTEFFENSIRPFLRRFKGESKFLNAVLLYVGLDLGDPSKAQAASTIYEVVIHDIEHVLLLEDFFDISQKNTMFMQSTEIASSLNKLHQEARKSPGSQAFDFITQVERQVLELPAANFEELVLPLVEEFVRSDEYSSPGTQKLVDSLLTELVQRFVQRIPSKPKDWVRSEEADRCSREDCRECKALFDFLADPVTSTRTFYERDHDLLHLYWRLHTSFYRTWDKSSSEQNIVVEKTLKTWKESVVPWRHDVQRLKEKLAQMPQERLKGCLGDRYEKIMALFDVGFDTFSEEHVTGKESHEELSSI